MRAEAPESWRSRTHVRARSVQARPHPSAAAGPGVALERPQPDRSGVDGALAAARGGGRLRRRAGHDRHAVAEWRAQAASMRGMPPKEAILKALESVIDPE